MPGSLKLWGYRLGQQQDVVPEHNHPQHQTAAKEAVRMHQDLQDKIVKLERQQQQQQTRIQKERDSYTSLQQDWLNIAKLHEKLEGLVSSIGIEARTGADLGPLLQEIKMLQDGLLEQVEKLEGASKEQDKKDIEHTEDIEQSRKRLQTVHTAVQQELQSLDLQVTQLHKRVMEDLSGQLEDLQTKIQQLPGPINTQLLKLDENQHSIKAKLSFLESRLVKEEEEKDPVDLEPLEKRVQALEEEDPVDLSPLQARIAKLEDNGVEVDLSPLQTRIGRLEEAEHVLDLSPLQARIKRLEEAEPMDLSPLYTRVVALEEQQDAVDLSPLQAKIARLEEQDAVDLSPLQARIQAIEEQDAVDLSPLESRIQALEEQDAIDLSPLQAKIARLEEAEPVDLSPLQSRIQVLEEEEPVDLSPLQGRIQALEEAEPVDLSPLQAGLVENAQALADYKKVAATNLQSSISTMMGVIEHSQRQLEDIKTSLGRVETKASKIVQLKSQHAATARNVEELLSTHTASIQLVGVEMKARQPIVWHTGQDYYEWPKHFAKYTMSMMRVFASPANVKLELKMLGRTWKTLQPPYPIETDELPTKRQEFTIGRMSLVPDRDCQAVYVEMWIEVEKKMDRME